MISKITLGRWGRVFRPTVIFVFTPPAFMGGGVFLTKTGTTRLRVRTPRFTSTCGISQRLRVLSLFCSGYRLSLIHIFKLGKNKPFLIVTTVIAAVVMVANWFLPLGTVMWVALVLNGFMTALSGPIIQAMTPDLPEIGAKYAGSAGGIIGTVGLLCSYFVPVIVSSISGDNWTLNFTIESILFLASVLPIAMLPETGAAAKAEMPETSEL